MKRIIPFMLLTVSVSVFTTLGTFWLLKGASPSIVQFDVKSTVNAYHQQLLQSEPDLEQQTRQLTQFVKTMNVVVADYQAQHNVIVLVNAAVVEGAPDVTPTIQRTIIERYQTQGKP
jgi:conjugal transfer pilin signal peptidase TrbI